jgi:hypothetical protein
VFRVGFVADGLKTEGFVPGLVVVGEPVMGLGACCAIAMLPVRQTVTQTVRRIAKAAAALCRNCILTLSVCPRVTPGGSLNKPFFAGAGATTVLWSNHDAAKLSPFGVDTSPGNPRHWKR